MEACEKATIEVLKEIGINPKWPRFIINILMKLKRIRSKRFSTKPDWEIWARGKHMRTVIDDKIIIANKGA